MLRVVQGNWRSRCGPDRCLRVGAFRERSLQFARIGVVRLIWRMRFDSVSDSAKLFEVISAKNEENFDRLEQHLMKRGALAG